MNRLENFIRNWAVLIFLGGLALIGLAPTLSQRTAQLFSVPPTKQSLTLRPFYIVDQKGNRIGWWRIKLDPTSVMIGDTANLEVAYAANPALIHPPVPADLPPAARYQRCMEANELAKEWQQPPADCGAPPQGASAPAVTPPASGNAPTPPISLLGARIKHSDLPFNPRQREHTFDLAAIFRSAGLSDNHIWHLTAEEGKTEPGRKSVIVAFQVEPSSFQQRAVDVNGKPVDVGGSEVPISFNVRTATGLPRQFGAICATIYAVLGAIGSSAAFLAVLKYWLGKRRAAAAPAAAPRRSRATRQTRE
jgi:hypothetical protein